MKKETEVENDSATSSGSHQKLEEARKVPPLGTSKGMWCLDGGPWPPETEEDKCLLF